MTIFLRLLNDRDKVRSLATSCTSLRVGGDDGRIFEVAPVSIQSIPGVPFAYWASDDIRGMFQDMPAFEADGRIARKGLTTSDDNRFVRLWWEPLIVEIGGLWSSYAKGGSAKSFHSDTPTVLRWHPEQLTIPGYLGRPGRVSEKVECADLMGRPGLTWPLRASKFCPSALGRGAVFSARGYVIQADVHDLKWILGITSSSAFDFLFKISLGRSGFPEFIVGILQKLPLPTDRLNASTKDQLSGCASRAWSLKRNLDTISETSHAFILPAALRARLDDYDPTSIEAELVNIQTEIDDIAFDLYGFNDADRAAALRSPGLADEDANDVAENAEDVDDTEDDDAAEAIGQTDSLLSWGVGVAFGRFDWRLATGEREAPPEPEPFDPLPAKSPGMLPIDAEPFYAHSGILVDDRGHPHDLPRLIEEILARVQVDVPGDVRRWLQRDFFPLHLKQYSKSRRKASIYWPLSTSSGSYTLWLYYPSLTSQTLYTAVNDFVEPKLKQVTREAAALREKGSGRSRDDEKIFEALQGLELELIELRDTLLRIAPTYRPNHDDGVQIAAAPLWQLFQHKPWQKVLKDTWTKLENGDYDWAQLAMAYWPDRVREKCKNDKSLAIAHDLEQLYEPSSSAAAGKRKKKGGAE
jgi:hypothetical protein